MLETYYEAIRQDGKLKQRGIELGLEEEEMDKIIHNIIKYGGKA